MQILIIYYTLIAFIGWYTRSRLLLYLLGYMTVPIIFMILIGVLFWPLWILVAPVLAPFNSYAWSGKDWIWPDMLYFTAVALPAAICRFSGYKWKAPFVYAATLLISGAIVNLIMDFLDISSGVTAP